MDHEVEPCSRIRGDRRCKDLWSVWTREEVAEEPSPKEDSVVNTRRVNEDVTKFRTLIPVGREDTFPMGKSVLSADVQPPSWQEAGRFSVPGPPPRNGAKAVMRMN